MFIYKSIKNKFRGDTEEDIEKQVDVDQDECDSANTTSEGNDDIGLPIAYEKEEDTVALEETTLKIKNVQLKDGTDIEKNIPLTVGEKYMDGNPAAEDIKIGDISALGSDIQNELKNPEETGSEIKMQTRKELDELLDDHGKLVSIKPDTSSEHVTEVARGSHTNTNTANETDMAKGEIKKLDSCMPDSRTEEENTPVSKSDDRKRMSSEKYPNVAKTKIISPEINPSNTNGSKVKQVLPCKGANQMINIDSRVEKRLLKGRNDNTERHKHEQLIEEKNDKIEAGSNSCKSTQLADTCTANQRSHMDINRIQNTQKVTLKYSNSRNVQLVENSFAKKTTKYDFDDFDEDIDRGTEPNGQISSLSKDSDSDGDGFDSDADCNVLSRNHFGPKTGGAVPVSSSDRTTFTDNGGLGVVLHETVVTDSRPVISSSEDTSYIGTSQSSGEEDSLVGLVASITKLHIGDISASEWPETFVEPIRPELMPKLSRNTANNKPLVPSPSITQNDGQDGSKLHGKVQEKCTTPPPLSRSKKFSSTKSPIGLIHNKSLELSTPSTVQAGCRKEDTPSDVQWGPFSPPVPSALSDEKRKVVRTKATSSDDKGEDIQGTFKAATERLIRSTDTPYPYVQTLGEKVQATVQEKRKASRAKEKETKGKGEVRKFGKNKDMLSNVNKSNGVTRDTNKSGHEENEQYARNKGQKTMLSNIPPKASTDKLLDASPEIRAYENSTDYSDADKIKNKPKNLKVLDQLIRKYGLQEIVQEVENYNLTEDEKSVLWEYCVDEIQTIFNRCTDNLHADGNQKNVESECTNDIEKNTIVQPIQHGVEDKPGVRESEKNLKSYEKKGILRFFLSADVLDNEEIVSFNRAGPILTEDETKATTNDELNSSTNNDAVAEEHSLHIDSVQAEENEELEDNAGAGEIEQECVEVTCDVDNANYVDPVTVAPSLRETEDKSAMDIEKPNDSTVLGDTFTETPPDKHESIRDEKVIYNPTKSKPTPNVENDLKQLLHDLRELDAHLLSETKRSYTEILPKPFNDEDAHPIHQKHYEIQQEDVQASLYQFDSNFHRYVAKAYSYENNMLDTQLAEEDEPVTSVVENDENETEVDFESPPDYPSKNTQYELSGDVLLLQDMLKRALGGDDTASDVTCTCSDDEMKSNYRDADTSTDEMRNLDTSIDEMKNNDKDVDTATGEMKSNRKDVCTSAAAFITDKTNAEKLSCEKYTENDYQKMKQDLLALLAKQETDLYEIRNKLNEIEQENEDGTSDDVTMDGIDEDEVEVNVIVPGEQKTEEDDNGVCVEGKQNGDKEEQICVKKCSEKRDQKPIKSVILQNNYMKNKRTKLGFTLRDCVSLYERVSWYVNRPIGMLACDGDCYIQHVDSLYPYIARLHGSPNLRAYVFALNKKSLKALGSIEDFSNVIDCAVDVRRSLANEIFPLACTNRKETQRVNNVLKFAVRGADRNGGVTAPFSFSDKDIADLVNRGMIKLPPDGKSPFGSSIYKENAGKVVAILNYQEHIRVICSSRAVDLKRVFEDAASLLNTIEEKLGNRSQYFAWDDTFGYLNCNPEHLGMAFCLSIRASFLHLGKNSHLPQILSKYGIEISSSFYNQKLKKMVYTLRNEHQFETTELDMLKKMIEGVRILSEIDLRLEDGIPLNDLLAEL